MYNGEIKTDNFVTDNFVYLMYTEQAQHTREAGMHKVSINLQEMLTLPFIKINTS